MGRCFTELQNKGVGSSVIKTKKQCTSVAAILKQAESVGRGGWRGILGLCALQFCQRGSQQCLVAILRQAAAGVEVVEGILCLAHTTPSSLLFPQQYLGLKGLREVRNWGGRW